MSATFRFGKTLVHVLAEGCEDCGAAVGPWSPQGRRVLVTVAGAHVMADLPLCEECAGKRPAGEFAGLTPAHSDKPLGARLP